MLEHVAELVGRRFGKRPRRRGAGIGDQKIDRAPRRDGLLHAAVHSLARR